MLDTLRLKYFQGKQYIPDIKNAQMREQFRGFPILRNIEGVMIDENICPSKALKTNHSFYQGRYYLRKIFLDNYYVLLSIINSNKALKELL